MSAKKKRSSASRPQRRLFVLLGLLALLGAGLTAQRTWFSPEAREARLSRMSVDQLTREAASSQDPAISYHLARRRMEVGDTDGAVEAVRATLRQDAKYPGARATLGTLLLASDQDAEASLELLQAVQDDAGDAAAYLGLALLYQKHGSWEHQAQAAEAVTRIQPKHTGGWILRGQAAEAEQKYADAVRYYEEAVAADPGSSRARTLAAQMYLMLGDFTRAEEQARAAVRVAPKDPQAQLTLGEVLRRAHPGSIREAAAAFEQALSLGEPTGKAHLELARVLIQQQRYAEAEQECRLALRADPRINAARFQLSRSLRAQGKEADAVSVDREFQDWLQFERRRTVLNDLLARDPNRPDRWFSLGRLCASRGLWADARRATLSGLRRAPADPEGTKLLARIDRNGQ